MNSKVFFNSFNITENEIKKANKYIDSKEVIDCANSLKDSAIKFDKLNSKDKQIAAIILSKKIYKEAKK